MVFGTNIFHLTFLVYQLGSLWTFLEANYLPSECGWLTELGLQFVTGCLFWLKDGFGRKQRQRALDVNLTLKSKSFSSKPNSPSSLRLPHPKPAPLGPFSKDGLLLPHSPDVSQLSERIPALRIIGVHKGKRSTEEESEGFRNHVNMFGNTPGPAAGRQINFTWNDSRLILGEHPEWA